MPCLVDDTVKYENYDEVMGYAQGVCDGKIIANNYRIKACQRFLDDLKSDAYDFRPELPERIILIIESTICHMKGEDLFGKPLRGTPFLLMSFHKFIVYNLFGFWFAGTRKLKHNEALIFIPRKNVKTSFAAALAWAAGLVFSDSGSTIYLTAAALKQSLQSFNFLNYNVKNMGEEDRFRIIDNNNEHSISGKVGENGFLEIIALAANPDEQDSFGCNFAIADEIHAFKKTKQYTLFKDAMKSYTNKMMIGISTAGDDANGFLAYHVEYCKGVLDGKYKNDRIFAFICEADPVEKDGKSMIDLLDPVTQEKANPAYGVSIRPDELMEDAKQAMANPKLRTEYMNKSLNVFTASMDAYFDQAAVQASDERYSWTLEELAKLPIEWYGGADLSKRWDLSGAALHGRYKDVDIAITHGFIPVLQARKKAEEDNIPFFWWEESGWLTLCNSEIIDMEDVVKWFLSMRKMGFKIKWIGYDRRYSREFVLKMKKAKFKVRDQSQRYVEKTEAFREIENQIIRQKFYYLGNKAFEYCIGNVKAIEDSDDFVRFQKILPTRRIDLFDADVIAVKQMLIGEEKKDKLKGWTK